MPAAVLTGLLREAARRWPERPAALEAGGGSIRYDELDRLSDRAASLLWSAGVRPGDRVGIALPKSIDALACLYGAMKAGAAYVPVDPAAPASRNALILADCEVAATFAAAHRSQELIAALALESWSPGILSVEPRAGGAGLARLTEAVPGPPPDPRIDPGDLAYVLYTSGSTGRPKGVMLTHGNALAFVGWCAEELAPVAEDRFSSHAPLHFDLSILDLYVPLAHGACVVLIGAALGRDPGGLATLVERARITVWYSTPSILRLLVEHGDLGGRDLRALRLVLFAGEVYPVGQLRALRDAVPGARMYNLYGPTETNVCTYQPIPDRIPADRERPFPIGRACSGDALRVVDPAGDDVEAGVAGELLVSGPSVMRGYWKTPRPTAEAFLEDAEGRRWYRTGDLVIEGPSGVYDYVGRRDRMVKRRGYRVELGEIEAGLYRHPELAEVAVVATADEEAGVRIDAYVSPRGADRPSIIQLKRHCSEVLPLYMVPDRFVFLPELPKTSTDKIDYRQLETKQVKGVV
jgi:amino acid adenylation domain-containing protein